MAFVEASGGGCLIQIVSGDFPTVLGSKQIRTVAIIPARGGSKGIKRKNLRPVGGIPLITRTVQAALAAEKVDLVIVSSDDDELLQAATAAGASAVRRPAEFATDQATSESALLHAIDVLEGDGHSPEIVVFLQCTSPFTTAADVNALVTALDDPAFQAALTVSPNHGFLWRRDDNGMSVGINHDESQPRKRRQDLPPEYRENGAGYAMRIPAFKATGVRFCGPVALVETGLPIYEIDDEEDLVIIDAMIKVQQRPKIDRAVAARLKALVTDFDGVHTDDNVYVGDDGRESVRCSRSDGLGVSMLREAGVELLILSKEENPVVTRRARKLRAEVLQGIGNKVAILEDWLTAKGFTFDDIAYLGNDLNDRGCMERAALAFAPADAHESVHDVSIPLTRNGGAGAVREACDIILAARG